METRRINTVDWWSDDARMMPPEAPAGIVVDDTATKADAMSMPVATPVANASYTDAGRYPVQSAGAQQVAPVIQPLVIVPYVSKDQPLRYLDKPIVMNPDEKDDEDEEFYEDAYETKKASKSAKSGADKAGSDKKPAAKNAKKKARANGGSMTAFIFGMLYIIALFDWSKLINKYLADFKYNHIVEGSVGYSVVYDFIDSIAGGSFKLTKGVLPDLFLTVGIVLTVFTIIVALCSCAARTPLFFKLIAVFAFLFHVVAFLVNGVILPLVAKQDMVVTPQMPYLGMAILALLSLLIMICMLAARNKKKR